LKLQKVKAYEYDGRPHYKYMITIPEHRITKLEWEAGCELKASIEGRSLVIDYLSPPKKREKKASEVKMSYEDFRGKIKSALEYNDNGMTWTEIRNYLRLQQVVPNNKWVRQMQKDIGLIRLKDPRGIVWRIRHV
jgi:hypothetical protein